MGKRGGRWGPPTCLSINLPLTLRYGAETSVRAELRLLIHRSSQRLEEGVVWSRVLVVTASDTVCEPFQPRRGDHLRKHEHGPSLLQQIPAGAQLALEGELALKLEAGRDPADRVRWGSEAEVASACGQ